MNNKCRISALISWAAVLLWMILIFNFSSQVAEQSDQLSKEIVRIVIEIIDRIMPGHVFDVDSLNHIIRKNAHFFVYLVLGVLVMNALGISGVRGLRTCALAVAICALYAVSDEVHQLFVPGRGGQVRDVLIDSAGAAVGIGTYRILGRLFSFPWRRK